MHRPRAASLPVVRMTPRLIEVQGLMADGLSNKDIATRLGLTVDTAKQYASYVLRHTRKRRREIVMESYRGMVSRGDAGEGLPRMGAFE
jgi:DNA-binding NarL/FixJ family response regulator